MDQKAIQKLTYTINTVILILVFGTIWMGRSATSATEEAVHSVSLLYMDELAERRAQVVQENLEKLRGLGYQIIEPKEAMLACGTMGKGALADVEEIVRIVETVGGIKNL